jgi:diguanylate cyclase (GGDEF)-like protein
MVARYGGEEFVALLPETPAAGAQAVGEKLRQAVENLGIAHEAADYGPADYGPSGYGRVVTISLGGAVWEGQAAGSPEELVAQADAALYRAKKAGRNRFVAAWDGASGDGAEA